MEANDTRGASACEASGSLDDTAAGGHGSSSASQRGVTGAAASFEQQQMSPQSGQGINPSLIRTKDLETSGNHEEHAGIQPFQAALPHGAQPC